MKMSCWRAPLTVEPMWQALEAKKAYGHFRRVDDDHPGDFYVSLDSSGRRGLVLITDTERQDLPSLANLEIFAEAQGDGRWRTYIWLRKKELQGLFTVLADDIPLFQYRVRPAERI